IPIAGDRFVRALVYFLGLCYLFIGVSIIADRFMAAIEVITSQEKEVTVKRSDGSRQIIVVRVWNETVANLTLMALGSSAPEIMLSVIEIYAKNFVAGDLGPGTIVGSAAFNLFIIIGLCVYVIPDKEVRKIKHLRVFFITATWSVFAYIWLYFILTWSSYGEVEVWEGLLTFIFFPATVVTAYIADRRLLFYKYLAKDYRLNRRGIVVEAEGGDKDSEEGGEKFKHFEEEYADEKIKEFEDHRREFICILKDLRQKNPNMDMITLVRYRSLLHDLAPGFSSRMMSILSNIMSCRIQATRKLTGGGNLAKKTHDLLQAEVESEKKQEEEKPRDPNEPTSVYFDPGHYTVMESVGSFTVTVSRDGGDLGLTLMVDYSTEDGTANAGGDYEEASGTLVFRPGDRHQTFDLTVIDDDVFEEDEHFYVRLSNLRVQYPDGRVEVAPTPGRQAAGGRPFPAKLDAPALATVMILDDDHCGIFNLADKDMEIVESVGECEVKVTRWSGARGRVAVPYRTVEGTAKPEKDYEPVTGELVFENEETEKNIIVRIIEEDSYEKDVLFYVEITEPRQILAGEADLDKIMAKQASELTEDEKIAMLGKPKLGDNLVCQVNTSHYLQYTYIILLVQVSSSSPTISCDRSYLIRVKESKEFKNTVDKLLQRANASIVVGTSSWKEQFSEALTVSAGDDDGGDDDDDEGGDDDDERLPSCGDYIMHFLTLFWKLLFAFVPPTDYWDGWLCFTVAILWIGLLTAFIGDLAGHFGCAIGLADSVTAISFVALGTSIPDTFASKVAAIQ
ncbi:unnamed protein product, partial [Notodromas monacha]